MTDIKSLPTILQNILCNERYITTICLNYLYYELDDVNYIIKFSQGYKVSIYNIMKCSSESYSNLLYSSGLGYHCISIFSKNNYRSNEMKKEVDYIFSWKPNKKDNRKDRMNKDLFEIRTTFKEPEIDIQESFAQDLIELNSISYNRTNSPCSIFLPGSCICYG